VRRLVAAAALAVGLTACRVDLSAGPPSAPTCNQGSVLILMAQSVPSATFVPCITEFPAGWTFGGEQIESGRSQFWLDSDRAGLRAVTVTLARSCDTRGAVRVPVDPNEAGTARYERPEALPPHYAADRFYTFLGGCITYQFSFQPGATFTQALEATGAIKFFPRALGVKLLQGQGFTLCGAGTRCPG
jgi:hypothetical protein